MEKLRRNFRLNMYDTQMPGGMESYGFYDFVGNNTDSSCGAFVGRTCTLESSDDQPDSCA